MLRQRSQKEGRAITFAEAVEQLFTEALMGKPYDEVEEKMRLEAHREQMAKLMAKLPLVKRAKAVAEEIDFAGEQEDWSHGDPPVSPRTSRCCGHESGLTEEEDHWSHRAASVAPTSSGLCGQDLEFTGEQGHWSHGESVGQPCSSDCCAPFTEMPHQDILALATGHLRFNPESRLATPAQRLALLRRDRYRCQCPSCPNTRFLDLHHVRWYSQKGETQPGNLTTLCRSCHTKVHEKKLFISGNPEQGLTFTDAEGRSLNRLHRLEAAAWLDYWIGWTGEEHENHWSRVGEVCEGLQQDVADRKLVAR